ncbi:unnamed protein product [Sphagnum compactum]
MYVTAVGAGAAGVAAARPPSAVAVGPQSAASNRHSGAPKAFCVDVSVLLPHWYGLRIVGPSLQSRCKAQGQKCVWNNPFVTKLAAGFVRRRRRDVIVASSSNGRDGTVAAETRAKALRRLLASPGLHQGPACYDALSAKLVEMAGFSFSFMSGFAVSTVRLAAPDAGLISYGEMVEQGRCITAAVSIPIIGDGDTGYGNALNVKRTVKGYIQAGFAGILLEDQVTPKACGHTPGRQVIPREEAVTKIRAAIDARNESGSDIVIVARTDARQAVSLNEALWRVQAFADAGADVLFIDALASVEEMSSFCRVAPRVPKMANMLEGGGKTPILSPFQLEELGFKIVAYPLSLLGVSIRAMQDALAAIKSGRLPPPSDLPSFDTMKEIVGYPEYYKEEERYATNVSMPPRTSDSDGRERVTLVPDQVLGPQDINSVGEQQLREGVEDAGMRVSEVMESLSPDGMRKSFAGMWSRTLRVKITGRDGIVKLNVSIPAGFLEGLSKTIPAVAGLDLRLMLEKAEFNLRGNSESGQTLADFTDPAGDRIEVILT